jgi:seryl-tRNA synthetase
MLPPEEVVRRLRDSGSLWDVAAGISGLRGQVATLRREIEGALADIARAETPNEWCAPAGVSFETLERAQYFSSFPQWLSTASHLSGDEAALQAIASSPSPARAARSSACTAEIALPPAVCYNTYAALADSTIDAPLLMTAQGTCWRHEGDRHAALERGWAFTMREIVCLGTAWDVKSLLDRGVERASALAARLELETEIVVASDPFFAPSARGRAALQRIKGLKHELVFRFPDGRPLAIASFNDHEEFFGDAFAISLADGTAASSGCVAFGLERWLLAVLVTYGVNPADWPFGALAGSHRPSHSGAIGI